MTEKTLNSAEGEYNKAEGLVAVVIVVAFLMVGVGILVSSGPAPVSYSASQFLYPASDHIPDAWNEAPCATDESRWDELDEPIPDGNTTCRKNTSGFTEDIFEVMQPFVFDISGSTLVTIDAVTASVTVLRESGNNSVTGSLWTTDSPCVAATINSTTSASYVTLSRTWYTCPGTVIPWTATLISTLGIAVVCPIDGPSQVCRATQMQYEVVYTYETPTPPTPQSQLASLIPFVMVAVAIIFTVAVVFSRRTHE